jgi:FKBP-type peptidyl-prolyl cis-trans isomerase
MTRLRWYSPHPGAHEPASALAYMRRHGLNVIEDAALYMTAPIRNGSVAQRGRIALNTNNQLIRRNNAMKLLMISALLLGFVSVGAYAQGGAPLKSRMDSVSYSIGLEVASGLQKQKIDVNTDVLVQGIRDALAGKSVLSPQQKQACLSAFEQELMTKQIAELRKAGDDFLAENKKKKGVSTTPSGLQYEVIKQGTGQTPKTSDNVTVHYTGTLIDGTEFDSSVKRGQPASFQLDQVIKGWTEGLQLMKVGSKYRFYIPSDLAYGANPPQGAPIPPYAVLIFDVELLAIK